MRANCDEIVEAWRLREGVGQPLFAYAHAGGGDRRRRQLRGDLSFKRVVSLGQSAFGPAVSARQLLSAVRAAVRISSPDGNFPTPANPSAAHSTLAQRTMPSRSIKNCPLS